MQDTHARAGDVIINSRALTDLSHEIGWISMNTLDLQYYLCLHLALIKAYKKIQIHGPKRYHVRDVTINSRAPTHQSHEIGFVSICACML